MMKKALLKGAFFFLYLETARDVFHAAVGESFDHALVGGEGVEGSVLLIVSAGLDVVEGLGVESFREFVTARVPSGFDVFVFVFDVHG